MHVQAIKAQSYIMNLSSFNYEENNGPRFFYDCLRRGNPCLMVDKLCHYFLWINNG